MKKIIERNDFGKIHEVGTNYKGQLVIRNENGNTLYMTSDYPEIAQVEDKAKKLLGRRVKIYTSQTTNDWSNLKWFCDLQAI